MYDKIHYKLKKNALKKKKKHDHWKNHTHTQKKIVQNVFLLSTNVLYS